MVYEMNTLVESASWLIVERLRPSLKDGEEPFKRVLSSKFGRLCYSTPTMSEINKGIPETVTQQAQVIDFEAARGDALNARKNKLLQGLIGLSPLLLPYLQRYLQKQTSRRKIGSGLNSARPRGRQGKLDLLQKILTQLSTFKKRGKTGL